MKFEEVLAKLYEYRRCDLPEKADRRAEWQEALRLAADFTKTPVEKLERILLDYYPQYESKRIAQEMPFVPKEIRKQ